MDNHPGLALGEYWKGDMPKCAKGNNQSVPCVDSSKAYAQTRKADHLPV